MMAVVGGAGTVTRAADAVVSANGRCAAASGTLLVDIVWDEEES